LDTVEHETQRVPLSIKPEAQAEQLTALTVAEAVVPNPHAVQPKEVPVALIVATLVPVQSMQAPLAAFKVHPVLHPAGKQVVYAKQAKHPTGHVVEHDDDVFVKTKPTLHDVHKLRPALLDPAVTVAPVVEAHPTTENDAPGPT